ncbi:DUF11 domain-containing protein [Deinococcus koreensis]|uniref:DUF11 domain-containing protein n=1 Tax=Deinococcus koreensis TaxID=2054903 RepID=A0A2K3USM3_9DEIO|nr:DUF11 domain-containing protein [Deinococcus koreensis]PNY79536.1 hypothetical protein CVO96_19105 [Deinococcus koreensis]
MLVSRLIHSLPALALVLGVLNLGTAQATGTPAGTVIQNQAVVTVAREAYISNPVETTVNAICGVSVRPDGTFTRPAFRVGAGPGTDTVLPYRVTNTGNAAYTLALSWLIDGRSTFTPDPASVRIYRDSNGDGLQSAGDPLISSLNLDADGAADVLLVARTPLSATGSAFMSLVSACPGGGAVDNDNMAQLRVGQFAELQLEKRFTPATVAPGTTSTVTLRLRNTGALDSAEVLTEDLLATPELRGLDFVPGSLKIPYGSAEYLSAGGSSASEPALVSGLRWRVAGLGSGQTALLSFEVRPSERAAPGPHVNVAVASGLDLDVPLRAEASLTVLPSPRLELGPAGNAPAGPGGEGSGDDLQRRDDGVVGQPSCFRQTLHNAGNVADSVGLSGVMEVGLGSVALQTLDGLPLPQPLPLAAGASLDFLACVTVTAADPSGGARIRLITSSAAGALPNLTRDELGRVDARLPALSKTVSPEGTVPVGTELTYTLTVQNPYAFALTDLVLEDRLDAFLVFTSASAGGRYDAGTRNVTWHWPSLQPGETLRVLLHATVDDSAPDDTLISNRFSLAARELNNPVPSLPVTTPVFTSAILVAKSVAEASVTLGDRLSYTLKVHNTSRVATVHDVRVSDTPSVGLAYLPGTAKLDGRPLGDPQIAGQTLAWTLPDLAPGQEVAVTYQLLVTPDVRAPLENVVVVSVRGARGSQVLSARAHARTRLEPGIFAPTAELLGQVYVDQNRDGRFQAGQDTPVAQARVLLAGGRSVLTDAQGRYHFSRLPQGVYALRLDPAGLFNRPRPVPQDGGQPGTRSLNLSGLTSVDFPLEPLTGAASSLRETEVRYGPVTLGKRIAPEGLQGGQPVYRVTLTLSSPEAQPGLRLRDPLPEGATLLDGQHDLDLDFAGGSATFGYRFTYTGARENAVTDPTLMWGER